MTFGSLKVRGLIVARLSLTYDHGGHESFQHVASYTRYPSNDYSLVPSAPPLDNGKSLGDEVASVSRFRIL